MNLRELKSLQKLKHINIVKLKEGNPESISNVQSNQIE
jgi:hypothetical protein